MLGKERYKNFIFHVSLTLRVTKIACVTSLQITIL